MLYIVEQRPDHQKQLHVKNDTNQILTRRAYPHCIHTTNSVDEKEDEHIRTYPIGGHVQSFLDTNTMHLSSSSTGITNW
jgi:hypothetical protein